MRQVIFALAIVAAATLPAPAQFWSGRSRFPSQVYQTYGAIPVYPVYYCDPYYQPYYEPVQPFYVEPQPWYQYQYQYQWGY